MQLDNLETILARDNPGFCTVHRFPAGISIFVEERSLVLLLEPSSSSMLHLLAILNI